MKRSTSPKEKEREEISTTPPAPLSSTTTKRQKQTENDDGEDSCVYIDASTVNQRHFFDDIISKRRPAVIRNCALDILAPLWATRKKDPSNKPSGPFCSRPNLEQCAGDTEVDIDVKTKDKGFGHGNLKKMSFSDFCRHTDESSDFYLTTQPIAVDEQDRPHILSQPLLDYCRNAEIGSPGQVPFMPPELQLMNVNLWIGRTSKPTSSRFHHDYHDNVYFLLKGRKRFRLSSYKHAKKLPTVGTLAKVHDNGRIVYAEQEPVREDGAPLVAAELLQLSVRLAQIQQDLDDCSCKSKREELENELEDILQRQLELEADDEESDFGDGVSGSDESSDEEEDAEFAGFKFGNENDGDEKPSAGEDSKKPPSKTTGKERVLNFCQFDSIEAERKGIPVQEVELGAGDVLYLPAGWYHEVFSSGSSYNGKDTDTIADGWHPDVHMALNYWYFPPNSGSTLEKPYHDDFWKNSNEQA